MPASAAQTKTWFRPNGWFTDRELSIVVNRVLRDDPHKGDMHNRQAITPRRLWAALAEYDLWPIYAVGLVALVPQATLYGYMTLILRALRLSTINVQLLVIPFAVMHIVSLVGTTWVSEKLDQRALLGLCQAVWTLPCVLALYLWRDVVSDRWGTYALIFVLFASPHCSAINVAWVSKNSNNVGSRSVSAAVFNSKSPLAYSILESIAGQTQQVCSAVPVY